MLRISNQIFITDQEVDITAIRAQGPGGQNVNKVSTGVHLRFDVQASSLPAGYKERLLALRDQRLNKDGVIVIKATQFRTQEQNRADALERLAGLIRSVAVVRKKRRPTKPSRAAQRKRLDSKKKHGLQKTMRTKVV